MSFILKLNVFSKQTSTKNLSYAIFITIWNDLFSFLKSMRNFLSDAERKIHFPRALIQLRNQVTKLNGNF